MITSCPVPLVRGFAEVPTGLTGGPPCKLPGAHLGASVHTALKTLIKPGPLPPLRGHIRASPEPLWSCPQAPLDEEHPGGRCRLGHRGHAYFRGQNRGETSVGSPSRTSVKPAAWGATREHSEGTLDNRVPAAAPTALRHLLPARPGTRRHSLEAGKQLCRTSKQGPQTRHCLLP